MDDTRKDWLALLTLCLVGAMLGRVQTEAREQGAPDLLTNIIQTTTRPVSTAILHGADFIAALSTSVFSGASLIDRNRRLEQMARGAGLYAETVSRLQREIDALRMEIGMAPLAGRQKSYAEVVGYFPREHRITIDLGGRGAAAPGAGVLTGDGLVGVVSTVSGSQAQVALLSSARLRIGAMVDRNPPAAGLLRGLSPSELLLELADTSAPVETNDVVITSGFGKLPRGIPIGRVFEVENEPEYGRRTVRVLPMVQIGNVREVVVLK